MAMGFSGLKLAAMRLARVRFAVLRCAVVAGSPAFLQWVLTSDDRKWQIGCLKRGQSRSDATSQVGGLRTRISLTPKNSPRE